jgi:putative ABC transport system permease protein
MRLQVLWYFYRSRLRTHPLQELLAGGGIAIGVALVFAVQIANRSIGGSADQILHGITGGATLQVAARDSSGFDASLLGRIRRIPGVARAAVILEQRAMLTARGRRVPVELVGTDPEIAGLGGALTRDFNAAELKPGLVLPGAVAAQLGLPSRVQSARGISSSPVISAAVAGRATLVPVTAVLGSDTIGPLSGALVAISPLRYAQQLAGTPNSVTRALVQTLPGAETAVRGELTQLVAGRLTVASIDAETALLRNASGPNDQATELFAAISALVGLLLAFNAMLLTAPERRRLVAELRLQGYRPRQLVQMLMFQAGVLGIASSGAGLLLGDVLSRGDLSNPPGYLASAFVLGTQRVVDLRMVALAGLGGIIATLLAAASPLLDLRPGRAPDAIFLQHRSQPGQSLAASLPRNSLMVALVLLLLATLVLAAHPALTMLGVGALALATLCVIPAAFTLAIRAGISLAGADRRFNMLTLALLALRATTLRSLALAATAAIAVFGSVAIEGAHRDLLNGLYHGYAQYSNTTDLWITNADDDLAIQAFRPDDIVRRLALVPGVQSASLYNGGLLDIGNRRVWVIGRPARDANMIPPSQLLSGNLQWATSRLRGSGWVVASQQLADAHGLRLGDRLTVPTPTGNVAYRLAATTTNLGWGPGAVILNGDDYRRAWRGANPTAIEVHLSAGTPIIATERAVARALDGHATLQVATPAQRQTHADALARQGLTRLSEITTLLLLAAALAIAVAMGAAVWQRRPSLAALRLQSFTPRQLRRALLLESAFVLSVGCVTGGITGLYGHYLLSRWLKITTGFPAPFGVSVWHAGTFALVFFIALGVMAIPGYLASKAPPRLGLQE